jgi:carboxymethylenebutenolidase
MEDWVAGANFLRKRPDSTGKLGAVGFCYGGGVVNQLAVRLGKDLAAAARRLLGRKEMLRYSGKRKQ